jgi:hypothetical protein
VILPGAIQHPANDRDEAECNGLTLLRARSDAIDCISKRMVKNPGHEAQDDPAVELDDEDITPGR